MTERMNKDYDDIPEGMVPLFPFNRNEVLTTLNMFESIKKNKEQLISLKQLIEEKERITSMFRPPKNPREEIIQMHEIKTLMVWKRRKEHLEERIKQFERRIQVEIEKSKI